MGYYSDVAIMCRDKAYEEFKKTWEQMDFAPDKVIKCADDEYVIQWYERKWYSSIPEIAAIENVCRTLNAMEEVEYAYKKIIVGEDNYTEEEGNEAGLYNLELYTRVVFDIPDGEEIKL